MGEYMSLREFQSSREACMAIQCIRTFYEQCSITRNGLVTLWMFVMICCVSDSEIDLFCTQHGTR